MSFYTDASLVLIPSGVKNQKVYSAKPIDGSGDLTFSRASNATRVNSSGLVEKVRTNQALYSEDFTNAYWIKTNATLTGNTIANPLDGALTADTFTPTNVSATNRIRSASISLASAGMSIYVKANGYTKVGIREDITSGNYASYDLSSGSVLDSSGVVSPTITALTNGWYRISLGVTASPVGMGVWILDPTYTTGAFSTSTWTANGTSGIYVYGVQIEGGDIATDYIATTSAAVSVGPVSGLPRLDYSGGASCPSLLLEPQRTNVCLWSEQIDNAGWSKINAPTVTSNIATAPDGYGGADGIQDTTGGSFKRIRQTFSVSTNSTNTASVFVKKETTQTNFGGLYLTYTGGTSKFAYGIVNPIAGTIIVSSDSVIGATSTKAEDYGDWWRFSLTATDNGSNTSVEVGYYGTLSTNGTTTGIGAGSVRTIWGLQLELGASYATSYIPTLGASVTRLGDMVGKSAFPTSILNTTTAHSGFFELKPNAIETSGFQVFGFDNNTYSSYIKIYADTTGRHRMAASSGGSSGVSAWGVANQYNKFAWSYDGAGNVKFFCNGVASVNYSITLNAMTYFGAGEKSLQTNYTSQSFKQILLFNSKLTDAQLAELTTL